MRTLQVAPVDWVTMQFNLCSAFMDHVSWNMAHNVEEAVACNKRTLEVRTPFAAPLDWTRTQIKMGDAYMDRVCGNMAHTVEEALMYYKRTLRWWTREGAPLHARRHKTLWATHTVTACAGVCPKTWRRLLRGTRECSR